MKGEGIQVLVMVIFVMVIAVLAFFVYFIPSIIAFSAKKKNALAIFILNLFLGWSFIGWVAALVWALVKD